MKSLIVFFFLASLGSVHLYANEFSNLSIEEIEVLKEKANYQLGALSLPLDQFIKKKTYEAYLKVRKGTPANLKLFSESLHELKETNRVFMHKLGKNQIRSSKSCMETRSCAYSTCFEFLNKLIFANNKLMTKLEQRLDSRSNQYHNRVALEVLLSQLYTFNQIIQLEQSSVDSVLVRSCSREGVILSDFEEAFSSQLINLSRSILYAYDVRGTENPMPLTEYYLEVSDKEMFGYFSDLAFQALVGMGVITGLAKTISILSTTYKLGSFGTAAEGVVTWGPLVAYTSFDDLVVIGEASLSLFDIYPESKKMSAGERINYFFSDIDRVIYMDFGSPEIELVRFVAEYESAVALNLIKKQNLFLSNSYRDQLLKNYYKIHEVANKLGGVESRKLELQRKLKALEHQLH